MADYLTIDNLNVPFDCINIEKLHRITGETQRYRVKVRFYTQEKEIRFCITQDEFDNLKAQMEAIA